jgi:hypothetical protein
LIPSRHGTIYSLEALHSTILGKDGIGRKGYLLEMTGGMSGAGLRDDDP